MGLVKITAGGVTSGGVSGPLRPHAERRSVMRVKRNIMSAYFFIISLVDAAPN